MQLKHLSSMVIFRLSNFSIHKMYCVVQSKSSGTPCPSYDF